MTNPAMEKAISSYDKRYRIEKGSRIFNSITEERFYQAIDILNGSLIREPTFCVKEDVLECHMLVKNNFPFLKLHRLKLPIAVERGSELTILILRSNKPDGSSKLLTKIDPLFKVEWDDIRFNRSRYRGSNWQTKQSPGVWALFNTNSMVSVHLMYKNATVYYAVSVWHNGVIKSDGKFLRGNNCEVSERVNACIAKLCKSVGLNCP